MQEKFVVKSKKLILDLWSWKKHLIEMIRWAMHKLRVDEWLAAAVMYVCKQLLEQFMIIVKK